MVEDEKTITPGLYRHYKGQLYRVRGLARHSETLELLVVYECQYNNDLGKVWVRPVEMFVEEVLVDGAKVPRFEFISDET
ncbi:MAG TPA: DUF1653 domain-containing protein [Bacteriovoracaceae bacterium]|nr:DUF1653 domain-containing protein [Bacteriovoracaceae bacterium]